MKQFKSFSMILLLLVLVSCSKVVTLNFEKHLYDVNASKIVWIQLPGYSEEMPMLLKLIEQDALQKNPLETFNCTGKAWTYNLFDLKPAPMASFHHQITGSKNIKNSCDDFINRPIWDLLSSQGFKTSVLEKSANPDEEIFWSKCKSQNDFKKNLSYFHMAKASEPDASYFHAEEPMLKLEVRDYFDRACQKSSCTNSLFDNTKMLIEKALLKEDKFLFIIRDFSLWRALEKDIKNPVNIITTLKEISKILGYLNLLREENPDMLILLTSGQSLSVEIPLRVKPPFNSSPSVYSAVLARGAGAENFCGYFQHEDIFKRILWKSGYNF